MKKLIVLIPEGISINYFAYQAEAGASSGLKPHLDIVRSGRMKLRGPGASFAAVRKLVEDYKVDTVAIRVVYGGNEFETPLAYNGTHLRALEDLVRESPVDLPPVIKLLKNLQRIIPAPEILLFFETSFFVDLPLQERTYALGDSSSDLSGKKSRAYRKYGYHGLFHEEGLRRVQREFPDANRIISICLGPVPEVAAIYNRKPVMISSGSTPLEGLPGNTTCGDMDPGVVMLLESKLGPEMTNEMLSRKSGLSALAEKSITIEDLFRGDEKYGQARNLLQYRVLLSCGSAIAIMDGVDAVVFTGRYASSAVQLSEWLLPRLVSPAMPKLSGTSKNVGEPQKSVRAIYVHESLDRIIAEMCTSIPIPH